MIFHHSTFAAAITRLTVLAALSAACAQPAAAPSPPATTAAATTAAAAAAPAATPTASPSPAVSEFMTSEGYWTMGKADAKVLFVDSSDFG